jgi:hypothetical protein
MMLRACTQRLARAGICSTHTLCVPARCESTITNLPGQPPTTPVPTPPGSLTLAPQAAQPGQGRRGTCWQTPAAAPRPGRRGRVQQRPRRRRRCPALRRRRRPHQVRRLDAVQEELCAGRQGDQARLQGAAEQQQHGAGQVRGRGARAAPCCPGMLDPPPAGGQQQQHGEHASWAEALAGWRSWRSQQLQLLLPLGGRAMSSASAKPWRRLGRREAPPQSPCPFCRAGVLLLEFASAVPGQERTYNWDQKLVIGLSAVELHEILTNPAGAAAAAGRGCLPLPPAACNAGSRPARRGAAALALQLCTSHWPKRAWGALPCTSGCRLRQPLPVSPSAARVSPTPTRHTHHPRPRPPGPISFYHDPDKGSAGEGSVKKSFSFKAAAQQVGGTAGRAGGCTPCGAARPSAPSRAPLACTCARCWAPEAQGLKARCPVRALAPGPWPLAPGPWPLAPCSALRRAAPRRRATSWAST